jgi:hypothetical protein
MQPAPLPTGNPSNTPGREGVSCDIVFSWLSPPHRGHDAARAERHACLHST